MSRLRALLIIAALAVACAAARVPTAVPTPIPTHPPVLTPPTPAAPLAIHNAGGHFADPSGVRWVWRGATDFLLLQKFLDGQDIDPILDQRQHAGANLVRVFAMCQNLAAFHPQEYYGRDLWGGIGRFLDHLAARGLYAEITVFADAQLVMPNQAEQLTFWDGFRQFAGRPNVFLELVNENTHAGNTINAQAFRPVDGVMCSHGSNQTDEHPLEPFWNYVTYHARRDGPPDARGATNYAPSVFESNFPKDRPAIADEGIKTTDPAFAALTGTFAATGDGGTFHSQGGVTSALWTDAEFAAAQAFYAGLGR